MSEAPLVRLDDRYSGEARRALRAKLSALDVPFREGANELIGKPCYLVLRPGSPQSSLLVCSIRALEYRQHEDHLRIHLDGCAFEYLVPSTLNQGRWQLGKGLHALSTFDAILSF